MINSQEPAATIRMAAQGDRAALERLLLDHYTLLAAHVANRLPASLQAVIGVDDIIQQTFTDVFTSISTFEQRTDATFESWLLTIAENRIRDAIRAQNRRKRGGDLARVPDRWLSDEGSVVELLDAIAGPENTASQSMARREAIQAMQVAIAGLAPDYLQAVQLHFFQGRSLEETAKQMDRTTGAVRGLLDRAKKKIRESLETASHYFSSK